MFSAGEEGEYQRISEASSLGEVKKRVQAQIHAVPNEQSLPVSKTVKAYPASDPEDVFYADEKASTDVRRRRRASCDSLSTTGSGSRRSSIVDGTVGQSVQDPRKTLVVLIGPTSKSSSLVQKQRSWETFPRLKSKRGGTAASEGAASSLGQLKKADSFEGHEETVRTLVAAVQETRSHLHHRHAHYHRHHRKSKTN